MCFDYKDEICYVNKSFEIMLDSSSSQLVENLVNKLVNIKSQNIDNGAIQSGFSLLNLVGDVEEQYFSVNIHAMNWNNMPSFLCIVKNITKERETNILSFQDQLTGLFNRRYGMNYLENCISEGIDFQITFVDLDLLKHVNDVHGHNIGDEYIIATAKQLLLLPQPCNVLRLGGDEFLVVTHYQEPVESHLELLRKSFISEAKEYKRSFSYGTVDSSEDGKDIVELLKLADSRMYAYKVANKMHRE